ncbi:WXG100 family type VII secretion target [Mycolicibacterium goodii]|uniref:WXG100 family type VII secretion target n=1 Tax=Mycolicibacterium goodii TaxID=134601 RepID=A0ABS6HXH4_MYCGD|nr:WXG100 family type VII secretion target [Mycolicibacterium goodii]MBU8820406.1 WXG100 family type VII secretion target [Mycolicibacterium goodii]MBU8826976.1 WXG100 family type VII secretion target [Mycolicibacterium goodii]MBU8840501.1 WXG100 family type VII secretion target [Mycolicibacterium goodii]
MAGELEVDPVDLHMSSDHMDMHHADLETVHAAAHADIEAAQAGWVGASAAALQAKFAQWQAEAETLRADIAAHRDGFRTAAESYTLVDGGAAEAVDKQL